MARRHGGRGRALHPQTGSRRAEVCSFRLSDYLTLFTHPCSYLHVNGFIHRDIKAANLLIDDDGTVLLGDLGVAAPLNDEDHTHVHENGATKSPRIVVFDKDVNVAPRRSRVGKRRSFVGTVCYLQRIHVS